MLHLLFAAIMAMTTLSTAQAADGGPILKRVPIVVSDMEKSLRLYRDILHLSIESDNMMKPDPHDERVFNVPPGGLRRSVKFNLSPDQIRAIGLFEVKGYKGVDANAVHDHGIVLRVTHIDEIFAQAKAAELRIIDFVDLTTNTGDKGRELSLLDPDGHLVLVYQINSTSK